MPILGVIASSTRQGQATDTGAMFPIFATTVGPAGSSSISFTSIPSTYKHLQLRTIVNGSSATNFKGRFNGDTGNNYAIHYLLGDGSSASSGAAASTDHYVNGLIASTALTYAMSTVDIYDYSSTTKTKTTRTFTGYKNSDTSGLIIMYSGVWLNTAAINSITIFPNTGTFSQGSSFALYGIK